MGKIRLEEFLARRGGQKTLNSAPRQFRLRTKSFMLVKSSSSGQEVAILPGFYKRDYTNAARYNDCRRQNRLCQQADLKDGLLI